MTPLPTLDSLRHTYPQGATVRYHDTTLRTARHKSVTGEVVGVEPAANGRFSVRVKLKDSTLDTLPENLTLAHKPAPKTTEHETDIAL